MQMKTFEFIERQVIPINGVNSLVIEVTDNLQENFHGMRYCGRLIVDNDVVGFVSGFVTLMCIPNDQIAIPALHTEADLNDSNSFIIAIVPFQMNITADIHTADYGAVFDWDFAPKTSRSCMKGGKIVGQVTLNTGSVDEIIMTSLLSVFRTVV